MKFFGETAKHARKNPIFRYHLKFFFACLDTEIVTSYNPAKVSLMRNLLGRLMTLPVHCPHCEQEFVVSDDRPGAATVCPKCFHVFPVPPTPAQPPAVDNLDSLEAFWRLDDTSQTDEPLPAPDDLAQPRPIAVPTNQAGTAIPTSDRESKSPNLTPITAGHEHASWKATLLGCIFPLTVFIALIAFLIWYVMSRSVTTPPQN